MQEVFHYKEFHRQQQNLAGSLWCDGALFAKVKEEHFFFFKKSTMIELEVGLMKLLID